MLAVRSEELPGLNLTRATLNALLKYPYARKPADPKRGKKWGSYQSESRFRRWVRRREPDSRKCLEAEIMDWADDIAYAVNDAADFYRAGLIPLDKLSARVWKQARTTEGETELERFVRWTFKRWGAAGRTVRYGSTRFDLAAGVQQLRELFLSSPFVKEYSGSRDDRSALGQWTSHVIGTYVRKMRINDEGAKPRVPRATIPDDTRFEVALLKQLTWRYVILNPALAAQQYGQRRIVRDLFKTFLEAARAEPTASVRRVLPDTFEDALARADKSGPARRRATIRIAADAVAGLTEQQALDMHRRLTGYDVRSVFDPIVR